MNQNAKAIAILCSHLCASEDVKPFEPKEWSELAAVLLSKNLLPEQLLSFHEDDFSEKLGFEAEKTNRIIRLLNRSGSLQFEISKYENMGIHIVTRADYEYPKKLKRRLGNLCPPLFYCAGNMELLNKPAIGYVGSRQVEENDIEFTKKMVEKTVQQGYGVVSGGAKGIDSISSMASIQLGSFAIEFISDSMNRIMKDSEMINHIQEGRVLVLSSSIPSAGFNVGMAMMRNKYIYAQSEGTVVIRSDLGKGGTWSGATENLKKNWSPTFCRDCQYPGNQEIIRLGAVPIGDDWNGNPVLRETDEVMCSKHQKIDEVAEQLSLYGFQ